MTNNKYRVPTRTLIFVAIAIAAIVCFASRQARPTAAQGEPTQPAIADCWDVFSGLLEREYHVLNAVSAISDRDVWAVGFHTPENSKSMTLVTHWDGISWTVVPSPSPGAFSNILTGVAAIAPDNVWAVGSLSMAGTDSKTLILHWDGKVWTQVPSPNTASRNNNLTAIAAISANDVWAVGFYKDSPNTEQMLILHWDGSTWTQAPTPELPVPPPGLRATSQLTSVTAIAANDVWAVGYNAFDTSQSLITLHWNGTTWSLIPTPSLPQGGILSAVSASGSNNVWAVGSQVANQGENVSTQTLAIRWDGTAWSVVPTPNVSLEGNSWSFLNAVTALPGGDAWAFGTYYPNNAPEEPILLRWDGSTWSLTSSPVETSTHLSGAAITPGASTVWVVGARSSGTGGGGNQEGQIVRHTTSPCPSLTPVPTMTPPVPIPGTGSVTFPETGKAVTGIFLDYWKSHGGLMQQGYPISEAMGEVSDLNGRLYTVQYFERAIFEYHPENKPPYDVLLSQLGTFEYRGRYGTQGAPNQNANNEPGSVLVPETGKRLGGAFLNYWQNSGGLMQQGYPISDEFTEVSALNGKQYTVQYFERAVFEWHPENKPPYDVLLSHLGRFRYDEKYNSATPQARQIAANVGRVVGGGRYLIWEDKGLPNKPIYALDTATNVQRLITSTSAPKLDIATDGKSVVWLNTNTANVEGYNLEANTPFTLPFADVSDPGGLVLNGDTLFYSATTPEGTGIYTRSLATGDTGQLLFKPYGDFPDVSIGPAVAQDSFLLWGETRRYPPNGRITKTSLHLLKLDGSMDDIVLDSNEGYISGWTSVGMSGDNVVWSGGEEGRVHLYNVRDGTTKLISPTFGAYPVIGGNWVAWTELAPTPLGQPTHELLQVYNMIDGSTRTVAEQREPGFIFPTAVINEKALAYRLFDQNRNESDLYLTDLAPK